MRCTAGGAENLIDPESMALVMRFHQQQQNKAFAEQVVSVAMEGIPQGKQHRARQGANSGKRRHSMWRAAGRVGSTGPRRRVTLLCGRSICPAQPLCVAGQGRTHTAAAARARPITGRDGGGQGCVRRAEERAASCIISMAGRMRGVAAVGNGARASAEARSRAKEE